MSGATVEFRFETPADEGRFLQSSLADAWGRFEAAESWETGWF